MKRDMNGMRWFVIELYVGMDVQNVSERGVERSDKWLLGSLQRTCMLLLPLF